METLEWDLRMLLEMMLGLLRHHENIGLLELQGKKPNVFEIKRLADLLQKDIALHI